MSLLRYAQTFYSVLCILRPLLCNTFCMKGWFRCFFSNILVLLLRYELLVTLPFFAPLLPSCTRIKLYVQHKGKPALQSEIKNVNQFHVHCFQIHTTLSCKALDFNSVFATINITVVLEVISGLWCFPFLLVRPSSDLPVQHSSLLRAASPRAHKPQKETCPCHNRLSQG